jgi:S-adenosylmethionine-diacylgycerolhomoserine-N-methlytransferase
MTTDSPAQAQSDIARYYRVQARIYDLTRWTFLRGREDLIRLAANHCHPQRILEVGCGTGKNLLHLGRLFPAAQLWGLDLSPHMLSRARRKLRGLGQRVKLVEAAYDRPVAPGRFDLVVFSYALSMFNPGWEAALRTASHDLSLRGAVAAVDFHDSPFPSFKRWMGLNHVRLNGHLLLHFQAKFHAQQWDIRPVYGGLWSYFFFLGQNMAAKS